MRRNENIISAGMGIIVSILLVWVFWQVISQLNFGLAILFLITAILIIIGAVLSLFRR